MKTTKPSPTPSFLATALAVLVAVLALFTAPSAFAVAYFYDGNGSTTNFGIAGGTWAAPTPGGATGWSTSTTGSAAIGSVTTTTNDNLNFGTDNATKGLGSGTITVSGTVSSGNIKFGSQTTGAIILSGGTISLTNTASINVGAGSTTHTISSEISGASASLSKIGPGGINLSGANTFTGNTIISAGTLTLGNVLAIQNTPSITIGGTSAGALATSIDGITIGVPITTANSGINSTISFGRNTSAAGTLTLNGAIGGNGNLIFSTPNVNSGGNAQTVILGAANTYAGATTITSVNSGNTTVIKAGVVNAIPTTTVLTLSPTAGSGTGRTTTFDLNGNNQTLAGLASIAVMPDLRAIRVSSTAAATLTINGTTANTYGGTGPSGQTATITGAISLVKDGTGTQTLSGAANSFTGSTRILGGILSLGNTGSLQSSALDTLNSVTGTAADGLRTTVTTLTFGGLTGNKNLASVFETVSGGYGGLTALTLNPSFGSDLSYSGAIADGAAGMTLTKTGTGTQTLSGANGWTGATTVRAGKLAVTTLPTGTGALAVTNGGILAITAAGAGQWTPASLTVDTCTLEFSNVNLTTAPLAPTAAVGTPVTNVVINVISLSGSPAVTDQFALIGNVSDATGYSIGIQPAGYSGSLVVNSGVLYYQVDAINDIWAGVDTANPTFWDIATSTNWTGNAVGNPTPNTYVQNDSVQFDDTATSFAVAIQTPVTPGGVNFNIAVNDYTVTGSGANVIGGTGGLTKLGAAKVTLLGGEHSFSGGTIISAGTVQLGDGTGGNDSAITNTSSVLNNGSLIYNQGGSGSASYPISGDGVVTKSGAGTMTLLGTNTYLGVTTIDAGTLEIGGAGSLGSGSYSPVITNNGVLRYASSAAQTLSGVISGSGAVTKANSSTLVVSGANTFTGQLTVENGKLQITSMNGISASGVLGSNALSVILGSSGNTGTIRFMNTTATPSTTKPFTLAAGGFGEFEINNAATTLALNAVLDGSGGLSKSGPGGLTLSAANTFTGPISVNLGTFNVSGTGYPALGGNNPGVNGPASITSASGTTLNFAQAGTGTTTANYYQPISLNTATLNTTGGSVGNTLNLTLHGGVTLGGDSVIHPNGNGQVTIPATTTVNLNAHTLTVLTDGSLVSTISAPIGGAGSIIKSGGATLTLANANTYTGNTTVSNGTLAIAVASIATNSTVAVVTPGILQLDFATTNRVTAFVLDGVTQASGVYNSANTAPRIAGTGTLLVNTPPVAGNFALGVAVGGSSTVSAVGKHTSDADGDPLTITAVSTPSSGTATIVNGTNITYTSTGGPGSDSFTYTVSDGLSTATATVTVTISSPEGFNKLSGPTGSGPYAFSYLGIPGEDYALEESPNLVAPYTWFPVITNTAAGNGSLDYLGVPLSYPSGSFRTRHIP